jgi:hypothetical protein
MNGLNGLSVGQIADRLTASRTVGPCVSRMSTAESMGGGGVGRGTGVIRHHFDIGPVTVSVIFLI